MKRRIVQKLGSAILAGSMWSLPVPVGAMPKSSEAAAKLEEGLSYYRDEDYAAAVAAFREGYELEPDPTFLYTWAQAERLRGECAEAVRLYNLFIEQEPPEVQAQAARDGKARCADALADGQTAEDAEALEDEDLDTIAEQATAEPSDLPSQPVEPPEVGSDEAEPPRPWQRDPAGITLVAIGSVGMATGAGLLIGGAVVGSKESHNYEDAQTRPERARTLMTAGGVVLGVGAALLIAGAIRFGVLAKRQNAALVGASLDGERALLWVRGRF